MKIKLLTVLICLCFVSFYSNAQEGTCVENFSIKTYSDKNPKININDIVIEWDFSNVENSQNLTMSIEIQPLDNCWEELNAIHRLEQINNQIDSLAKNKKGSLRVEHLATNAKCFKWRAVIHNKIDSCKTSTPWEFKSFL